MLFEESVKFEGDAGEVWKRAAAIEEIPTYWHGTRSLVVVGRDGSAVRVKVGFAFGGSGEAVVSTDEVSRRVTIDYRSGPFTGTQTITVGEKTITARWDVEFRGVYRLAARWNEGHFRSGTVNALRRLSGSRAGVASDASDTPSYLPTRARTSERDSRDCGLGTKWEAVPSRTTRQNEVVRSNPGRVAVRVWF